MKPGRYAPRIRPTIRRTREQISADRMLEFGYFLDDQITRVITNLAAVEQRRRDREIDNDPYLVVDLTLQETRS